MTASNKGTQVKLIDAGLHKAVCYGVVDVGTEHSDMFDKDSRKIILLWEIPDTRIEVEGKDMPRVLSRKYTNTLAPKGNLRKDLVSWRTREFTKEEEETFDLRNLAGASCLLNIIHKQKQDRTFYSAIDAILNLKGEKVKPEGEIVVYGIEENGTDIPESLPEWIVEQIKASPEYQAIVNPGAVPPPEDSGSDMDTQVYPTDEIPF